MGVIVCYCPKCGRRSEVSEQFAGQRGRCKYCRTMVTVPARGGAAPVVQKPGEHYAVGVPVGRFVVIGLILCAAVVGGYYARKSMGVSVKEAPAAVPAPPAAPPPDDSAGADTPGPEAVPPKEEAAAEPTPPEAEGPRPDAARPMAVFPEAVPAYARSAPRAVLSPDLALPPEDLSAEALSWPQEAPGLSAEDKERVRQNVWIVNNFGLYQYGDMNAYLHNGFDIVLFNGTDIYAVQDGYVKSTKNKMIIIADEQGGEPCFGWAYTHLGNIQVRKGELVRQGALIGQVNFDGLAHLHLQRVYSQSPHWGEWQYTVMPDGYFTYPDDEPPIVQTPFYFFRNGTDALYAPGKEGTVTVWGDVDIVVAMREQGLYAHSRENGFGDRLAVATIEYEIRSVDSGASHRFESFDFTRLTIKESVSDIQFSTELTKVVYKHPLLFGPDTTRGNRALSYYIITNCPGEDPPRELDPGFSQLAWQTAVTDASGAPLYPDGLYEIVVTARDFALHSTTATMRVAVRNAGQ